MIAGMKIGQLAKQTDISVDAIRYYEKRGLMPEAARSRSGYRQYSKHDAARLRFILQARELGFTLKEISQLLEIRSGQHDCRKVRAVALAKARDMEKRIARLSRMREVLLDMATRCEQSQDSDPCPMLKALEGTP